MDKPLIQYPKLPPEVEAYFETQRVQQQHFNQLTQVQNKLNNASDVMKRNMMHVTERGEQVEITIENSKDLMDSSFVFYYASMSRWAKFWYNIRRCMCWRWFCCCPMWWWKSCCPKSISATLLTWIRQNPLSQHHL